MNMKQETSLRILFLLNLLYKGKYSKNEIMEEFKKNGVTVRRSSINNYIEKLKEYDIPIVVEQIKKSNYYSIKNECQLDLKTSEINASSDVKRLLISEKNEYIIKKAMRVFYKFALQTEDKGIRQELINFGYYSKINWLLVKCLREHCKKKNIIKIDYLLPNGKNRYINFHADTIRMGEWSERLYLSGFFEGDNKISQLPIDKIFMIKKVIKENVRISFETKVLTYKVGLDTYNEAQPDEKESVQIKDNIAIIKRPADDIFFTIQRLLYFCPDLYYISDVGIKNLVQEKLYTLKDMYDDEIYK